MSYDREHARRHITSHGADDVDPAPGRSNRASRLQRKAEGGGVAANAEAAVATAATGTGSSLPELLRTKFERSLGTDLSGVRVHTGEDSAHAAASVGARAYAVGQDIHFGAGHFDPASPAGEHLLAHEVAHTVQQRGGSPVRQHKLEVSSPADAAEHEADRAADAMVAGRSFAVGGASHGLHRDAAPTAGPGVKVTPLPVEISFPLPKRTHPAGIQVEFKAFAKGEVAEKLSDQSDTNVGVSTGGHKFKGGKLDSYSLFKAEIERKLNDSNKIKASFDVTSKGINPAVEWTATVGKDLDFKFEFAPWKPASDGARLACLTPKLSTNIPYETDYFIFKGEIGVAAEFSIDAKTALQYLAKQFGKSITSEAAAMAATEGALAAMVIGGAVLVGLDHIDEERRAKLKTLTVGSAKAIIRGEQAFLSALAGRRVTATSQAEKLALAEATRILDGLAAKVQLDRETLACIAEQLPGTTFVGFRWRDGQLDALERKIHAGLDAWGKEHYVRSLGGLRTDDDKHNVTRWIEAIRNDPESNG